MKINILVFLLLAVFCGGCGEFNKNYAEYSPLRFDGNELMVADKLMTDAHFDRVEHVLKYYGIEYERTDGQSIEFAVPMDASYMWNMTSKAEDQEWLKSHLPGSRT